MTQKHVELLMKAVNISYTKSEFLCDRIRFITGFFNCGMYDKYLDSSFTVKQGEALVRMIQKWLDNNGGYDSDVESFVKYSFEFTPLYNEQGITRKEWAETILAPLALEIEED
jgi:hypothetical protein